MQKIFYREMRKSSKINVLTNGKIIPLTNILKNIEIFLLTLIFISIYWQRILFIT